MNKLLTLYLDSQIINLNQISRILIRFDSIFSLSCLYIQILVLKVTFIKNDTMNRTISDVISNTQTFEVQINKCIEFRSLDK